MWTSPSVDAELASQPGRTGFESRWREFDLVPHNHQSFNEGQGTYPVCFQRDRLVKGAAVHLRHLLSSASSHTPCSCVLWSHWARAGRARICVAVNVGPLFAEMPAGAQARPWLTTAISSLSPILTRRRVRDPATLGTSAWMTPGTRSVSLQMRTSPVSGDTSDTA